MTTDNYNEYEDENDQYTQYKKLHKLLQRFSFSEKMRIVFKYSRQALSFENTRDYEKLRTLPLPWNLETFTMIAIESKEYSDKTFLGRNEDKFIKMMNAIKSHTSEILRGEHNELTFVDYFLPVTALTQFHLQESFWIKYYRYYTIFSNNSKPTLLSKLFINKMGASYYEYLLLGIYLKALFLSKAVIPPSIIEYLLYKRFSVLSIHLIIEREHYITMQQGFTSNNDRNSEYLYSVRPSYQFPFVKYENTIYFPLPHLLTLNFTSALFYRITEGNDDLRSKIGKHILEPYLFQIIEQSGAYDEVFPEQTYKSHIGSEAKSPDVIARKGKKVLLLDSKSTAPSKGIRIFEESSFEKNICITADNIIKLYNQIKDFSKFNPFKSSVSDNINDYWGIIVVLEDSYILRKKYYEKVNSILHLHEDSEEWKWLVSHIKIVSLYMIERLSYCSLSVIDALKKQEKSGNVFDYPFSGTFKANARFTNKNLLKFKSNVIKDMDAITNELQYKGLIK